MSQSDASLQNEMLVPLNRRNYLLTVMNGILVAIGDRLMDPFTVLPLLLVRLTGLTWTVGLFAAINVMGVTIPQIFASRWIDTIAQKLPLYRISSVLRFMALIGMSAIVLSGRSINSLLLAALLLSFFALRILGQSVAVIAFMDIVGKSVPTTKRGSLWMWRQVIGLLLVLVVAVPLIKYLLSDNSPAQFPVNYGLLLLMGTIFMGIAWCAFSQIEEPKGKPARHRLTMAQHISRGLRFWPHDARYRRLVRVRFLLGAASAIQPFFIAFAAQVWSLPDAVAAIFITVQILGQMAGSFVTGYVSDRLGNRKVLIMSAASMLFTALFAGLAHFIPPGALNILGYQVTYRIVGLSICFAGSGVVTATLWPGYTNYMLDISPQRKRPSYLSFANLFILPVAVVPIAFCWLADTVSFEMVFIIAAVISLVALLLSLRIDEPRDDIDEEKLHEFD